MRAFLWAFLAVVSASPAMADCARPDVEPARRALEAALPKDDHETDVPARERAAIAAMKVRLGAYVAATFACAAPEGDAKALRKTLAAGAPKLDFAVRRVAPGLTAVTAGFPIQCGSDTMLWVFAQGHAVLRAQSAPYTRVSGAWDMFDYAVAPPDKAGRWFALTKTVAPWCSSTWSEIRYGVWRPARAAPLFQAKDPIWWGSEDYGRLAVGAGDFTIRFHAQSIDGGRHNREWVRRFQIQGDRSRASRPSPTARRISSRNGSSRIGGRPRRGPRRRCKVSMSARCMRSFMPSPMASSARSTLAAPARPRSRSRPTIPKAACSSWSRAEATSG
jgi:hypothetical protein